MERSERQKMSEIKTEGSCHRQTLCWDCANATGGCSWADRYDHTPVKGWTAIQTTLRCHSPSSHAETTNSFIVIDCPEFIRDAEGYGARRIWEKEKANNAKQQVITAYQCGVRIKDIEQASGFSETQIYNILKAAGIKTGKRRTGPSPKWAAIAKREE